MKLCLQSALFLGMVLTAQPSSAAEVTRHMDTLQEGIQPPLVPSAMLPIMHPVSKMLQAHFLPVQLPRSARGNHRRKTSSVQRLGMGKGWVIILSVAASQYRLI